MIEIYQKLDILVLEYMNAQVRIRGIIFVAMHKDIKSSQHSHFIHRMVHLHDTQYTFHQKGGNSLPTTVNN